MQQMHSKSIPPPFGGFLESSVRITSKQTSNINSSLSLAAAHGTGLFNEILIMHLNLYFGAKIWLLVFTLGRPAIK